MERTPHSTTNTPTQGMRRHKRPAQSLISRLQKVGQFCTFRWCRRGVCGAAQGCVGCDGPACCGLPAEFGFVVVPSSAGGHAQPPYSSIAAAGFDFDRGTSAFPPPPCWRSCPWSRAADAGAHPSLQPYSSRSGLRSTRVGFDFDRRPLDLTLTGGAAGAPLQAAGGPPSSRVGVPTNARSMLQSP
jgi:hypothetical protein